ARLSHGYHFVLSKLDFSFYSDQTCAVSTCAILKCGSAWLAFDRCAGTRASALCASMRGSTVHLVSSCFPRLLHSIDSALVHIDDFMILCRYCFFFWLNAHST